jgi:hypothetical protein
MIALAVVVISYSLVWIIGMYAILRRLYTIRRKTEKRIQNYDTEYIFPTFHRPWVFTVII